MAEQENNDGKVEEQFVIDSNGKKYPIPKLYEDEKAEAAYNNETNTTEESLHAQVDIGGNTNIKLNDVIGLYNAKKYVIDRLDLPYRYKEQYAELGLSLSRGMLLYGLPGVGKSFFLKAVIADLIKDNPKLGFIDVQFNQLVASSMGKSSELVHSFFSGIKECSASTGKDYVIIIDEMDVVAPKRTTSSVMTRERTSQLLKEIDSIEENNNFFIIGATNRPWDIDPAMLRSGRVEAMFKIDPPNEELRKLLLEKYLKKVPLDSKINFDIAVKYTEGFVGADFKQLAVALLSEALKTHHRITPAEFADTISRIKNWSNYFIMKQGIERFEKKNLFH